MSERERWIVYPLLFLTLGLTLHDKFGKATKIEAHRVLCDQLVVRNDDGEPQVVIDSTKAGGVVRAINASRTMDLVLGHEDQASSLFCETTTAKGTATRALLGNLQRLTPRGLLDWLGRWPLLDPRIHRAAEPETKPADSNAAGAKK